MSHVVPFSAAAYWSVTLGAVGRFVETGFFIECFGYPDPAEARDKFFDTGIFRP